ncbi:alpha-L-arabinofuranosidase C-terminal domain-containing protein [Arcicella sp. DC2W]|uniref:non-reducing end alpha-L-arabinofuranosidase n=1 Tax=Arcicella gelida TaxID=2984195 RepID=A0ABU5S4N5_9BACT|nr:alpha-L-arabinofuranosidase C-terminal domain-containing protein [Arcicella sp. DC2W]MEA5403396.1 alpha-L-arabinofuranosidase C-terminal domain-containing protein [Arcicella sp. DC2W]
MKKQLLAVACLGLSFLGNAQNTATLQADSGKVTINKHIYGHFAEHLGTCIYGGFYVGENNTKIPNKDGVRLDIIDALKKLKIPNLRWPGGCFADTYHWKDGIGPKAQRPAMVNTWWGGVTEDNSFGTHDFLNMCELLGTEPYISGNVGSGTVQELKDWTQYINLGAGTSPMSKLREQNGREKPWNVSIWGVGNEAWGCGGNMTADYYANIYRQYATFMAGTDKKGLFRVASGASDADYKWTETLMKNIPHNMLEGVAIHHYSVLSWGEGQKTSATEYTDKEYFKTMQQALLMDELVTKHSAVMDKYDPKKKVALVVDEWGGWYNVENGTNPGFLFQQNTMRDAMIAGATLNIFNNHADRIRMANLAQVVNVLQAVILTKEEKMILTPTYHVMEMYNVHQDATLLPIKVKSNDFVFEGEKLPAVSVSASKDAKGLTHISLTNVDPKNPQEITIDLKGAKYVSVSGRILASEKLRDFNSFDNPNKIQPKAFSGATISGNQLKVKLPAFSVAVLELK